MLSLDEDLHNRHSRAGRPAHTTVILAQGDPCMTVIPAQARIQGVGFPDRKSAYLHRLRFPRRGFTQRSPKTGIQRWGLLVGMPGIPNSLYPAAEVTQGLL